MAVEPRNLELVRTASPALRIVAPGPPRRPLAASIFFILLVGCLSLPVVRSATSEQPSSRPWSFRPPEASAITSIAPVRPMPDRLLPKSNGPLAGVVFVRCTRLWVAAPSQPERRLLSMPDTSDPAVAPDARTIAFFVERPAGQELWMAAADGSKRTRIGTVVDRTDTDAVATSLTWSPHGDELAFALVTPGADPWTGGSAIWRLDVSSGEFERAGSGWPAPFWLFGKLGWAEYDAGRGADFVIPPGYRRAGQLSSSDEDLSAGFAPGGAHYGYDLSTAILTRADQGVTLSIRRRPWSGDRPVAAPPRPLVIDARSRPALSSDGRTVAVSLLGPGGARVAGIYDRRTKSWNIIDYSWEPTTTPAPVAWGPPGAQDAIALTRDLFTWWHRRPQTAELILGREPRGALLPARGNNYVIGIARRVAGDWVVPVYLYGRNEGDVIYRRIDVHVVDRRGGLRAVLDLGAIGRASGISESVALLNRMLPAEIVAPGWLPEGSQPARHSFSAWRHGGRSGGGLYLDVPGTRGMAPGGAHVLQITYGDVGFYGGCGGGSGRPEAIEVAGEPALIDKVGTVRQVIWPATQDTQRRATFSVYGEISKVALLRVAESIEVAR